MRHITDNQDELFDIVDEDDRVIGQARREEVHKNKKLIHRSIGVCVFNSKGEIYLQKRSRTKDTDPGKWTISCSGHVSSGVRRQASGSRQNFLARKVSRFSLISKLQYRIFQTRAERTGFARRQNFLARRISRSSHNSKPQYRIFQTRPDILGSGTLLQSISALLKRTIWNLGRSSKLILSALSNTYSIYENAAHRELKEELGADLDIEFVEKYLCRASNETEMTALFKAYSEGPFELHPQEIEEGKFFTQKELKEALRKRKIELSFMGKVVLTKIGWI